MVPPEDAAEEGFRILDDDALSVLSDPATFHAFLVLGEGTPDAATVAREVGIPEDQAWQRLTALVHAGLAEVSGGGDGEARFRVRHRNLNDLQGSPAHRLAFRLAILRAAEHVVRDARRALRARPGDASVGIGLVTIPDEPAVVEEAMRIIAETENRLRALARERGGSAGSGPRARIAFLVGSF